MSSAVKTAAALVGALLASVCVASEFHPGWIYVSATAAYPESPTGDLIWAFDPATGNSELLADVGKKDSRDLISTPDGRYLLNALSLNRIGAIDPEEGMSIYLDQDDGVSNPFSMDYDAEGNLYVMGGGKITRFPGGTGPGEVLVSGITYFGPMTTGPNGEVYYASIDDPVNRDIIRLTPDGVLSVFATMEQSIYSLETDSAGNLYVQCGGDLFKFDEGDPNALHVLSGVAGWQFTNIRMSPDESYLYWQSSNQIARIDPVSGDSEILGTIPVNDPFHYPGTGMAVYVPEPGTLSLLLPLALSELARRRASSRRSNAHKEVGYEPVQGGCDCAWRARSRRHAGRVR